MEKPLNEKFTPLLVVEEASRCLLCHDAPCSKACPAGTNPAKFIRSVRFRNFKGAAEVVRENNVLGAICAKICPTEKLCKNACSRCGIDRPIEIGKIQEYVTDYEEKSNMKILKTGQDNGKMICIVGSGPSGLAAASKLRTLGYAVDVYEKNELLGGWLTYGIPRDRLPIEIINSEINRIKDLGVNFITNTLVGKNKSFDELLDKYDAILLATGFSKGKNLEIFNNSLNVTSAVDFLVQQNINNSPIDENATHVIIGGGDVAMDVACTLKNKGAHNVMVIARETLDEFLASPKELEIAKKLNVSILDGYTPLEVKDNTIIFKHLKLNSTLSVFANYIYVAIGQTSDLTGLPVEINKGEICVNDFKTNVDKVYACGDIISGDKLAVYAIKLGNDAALQIHKDLGGNNDA